MDLGENSEIIYKLSKTLKFLPSYTNSVTLRMSSLHLYKN